MSLVSRVTQKMALVSYDKITPILHHRRVSSPPRVHMRLKKTKYSESSQHPYIQFLEVHHMAMMPELFAYAAKF